MTGKFNDVLTERKQGDNLTNCHTISHVDTGAKHVIFGVNPIDCIREFVLNWPDDTIEQNWKISCTGASGNELDLYFVTGEGRIPEVV